MNIKNVEILLKKQRLIFKRIKNSEEIVEVFFLLGRLYFTIGDIKRLKELVDNVQEIGKENKIRNEK